MESRTVETPFKKATERILVTRATRKKLYRNCCNACMFCMSCVRLSFAYTLYTYALLLHIHTNFLWLNVSR